MRVQVQEFQIAERFGQAQVRHLPHPVEKTEIFRRLARAGVNREENGVLALHLVENVQNPGERFGIVDVARPVQRHHAVVPRLNVHFGEGGKRLRLFEVGQERVDHHVPHVVDVVAVPPLFSQVDDARRFGTEKKRADRVGHDPVDLFGHSPVAAPQTRLDVDERYPQVYRCQTACHRAVDVADHQNHIGVVLFADRFERLHNRGCLGRRRSAVNPQVFVRFRDLELVEEETAHLLVVVLAGVDQKRLDLRMLAERAHNRRDLHKIGPGAGDAENFDHRGVGNRCGC